MFALLPIIGGVLLGWLAPRKIAIVGQVLLYVGAVTVLTLTAPSHGGQYRDGLWIGPALALVTAATLYLGWWIHGRRTRT